MIVELIREGLVELAKQPLSSWWTPEEIADADRKRAPIGLSELESCIRQLWYQQNGVEEDTAPDPTMNLVWWTGHFYENAIISALRAVGVQVEGRQMNLEWEGIPGHPDGIIYTSSHPVLIEALGPNKRFLLELKALKPLKIKDLFRRGLRGAASNYLIQMQGYQKGIKETYGMTLDGGIFIAGNKAPDFPGGVASMDFYEEIVLPDTSDAEAQMQYVQQMIHLPEAPDRPYVKPSPLCPFCRFNKRCWGTED